MEQHNTNRSCCSASVISGPDVWMEGTALEQLKSVARMNDCVSVVGMPDLHVGGGIPIGAVAAFSETIYPHLVGSDAGCGARLVLVKAKEVGLDKLERRLHSAMDHAPWEGLDEGELLRAVWRLGARGISSVESLPEDLREMASKEPVLSDLGEIPERYLDYAGSLGTIGGGNHFLEVTKVTEVASDEHRQFSKAIGVLAHSGSRGMGYAMANHWGKWPLVGAEQVEYLNELEGAVRYAQANRLLLTYRALRALGTAKASKELLRVDVTHNTVRRETQAGRNTWVHRKGAAPAHDGQLTLVLGSREAPTWLMRGNGAPVSLSSVAHGAGRRMSRSEATAKLKLKHTKKSLTRTAHGGRVVCADSALLYEEHPSAYKRIEPVVAALRDAGAAVPLLALTPMVTLKM